MTKFEEVMKGIRDCERKNECFNTEVRSCLYFEPRETGVVLISESPYNYPSPSIITPEDFKNKTLNEELKKWRNKYSTDIPHDNVPYNIFAFIYDTFKPIFKNGSNLADNFLSKVYWTHVGKRRPRVRKEELFQCANLHLKKEIEALQPKLVVLASKLACNFFWNRQISSEGLRVKQTKLKEFLENQKKSLQQNNGLLNLPGYPFSTAIFPNPSPKNVWKKRYHKKYDLESVKKIVWDLVEQEYGT